MLKKEFTLRQYQQSFITNLGHAVKEHRRVIACAATGSGKSKTFLKIAANALKKGYTVLVITESRKIFKQLIAECHATEIKDGSKLNYVLPGSCYLAMAQTLRLRHVLIDQFKSLGDRLLIINDECHINQATSILLQLEAALLIGFSGSPVGKHLVKLYNHLVVGPQPHELVLDGFLSPYRHFERKRADMSELEINSAGEFSEESQEKVFGTQQVYDGIIEDLQAIPFKKCIIYTSSIRKCEDVADMLREHGFNCVSVHSKVDQYAKTKGLFNNVRVKHDQTLEQAYIDQFENDLIPICISVGTLTKGYDYPPTDLIVFLRATTSLALFLQICGRGSRVLPGEEILPLEQRKKKFFTVLDYGENATRQRGGWDFERDWQTLWRSKPKKSGVSPIKFCPQCDFMNAASAKVCSNCGYTFAVLNIDDPDEDVDTILVEITAKYNKLVGSKISELNPEELSIYAKTKGKKQFAIRVAKWHAHQVGIEWLLEFAQHMGYKRQWAYMNYQSMQAVVASNPNEKFEFTDLILR